MTDNLFEFSLYAFQNIIVFYFLNSLLTKRFKNMLPTVLAIVLNSGIAFACSGLNFIIQILISVCALCASCFVLYKDKPVIKITYSFLTLYILNIVSVIFITVTSLFTGRNIELILKIFGFRATASLSADIFDILIFALIYRMVSKIDFTLKNKYWIMFGGVILIFFSSAAAIFQIYPLSDLSKKEMIMYTIIYSLLLVVSLIVIYFFSEISKGFRRDSKLFLLENNYNNLQEQIEYRRQSDEKFRKIRHDMLGLLSNVRALIESGETASAVELLDKTAENVERTLPDKAVNTGNKIFDAILLSKLAVCRGKGISFDYSVEALGDLNIDITDLSSLISNLLDNAIEAAAQTDEPFVKISVFKYNAYCTICTENNYKGKESVKQTAGTLISTKSISAFHGYGTQIINDIARKYDGNFSWETRETGFIATVLLKI